MTREEFLSQLPSLVQSYQPAEDVITQIRNLDLMMVVGPSGVGKTTLIQGSGLAYVPSDTTRAKRPQEIEGEDFFFRSDYDNILEEIRQGRFLQIAVDSGGDFKATKGASYPSEGIVIMAVVADALPAFRSLGFRKTTSAFVSPPSYDEWMRRLLIHQLSPEQFSKRMDEAKRSLSLSLDDPLMHFILNDDATAAEEQLIALIADSPNPERESLAKQAAKDMLNKLLNESA